MKFRLSYVLCFVVFIPKVVPDLDRGVDALNNESVCGTGDVNKGCAASSCGSSQRRRMVGAGGDCVLAADVAAEMLARELFLSGDRVVSLSSSSVAHERGGSSYIGCRRGITLPTRLNWAFSFLVTLRFSTLKTFLFLALALAVRRYFVLIMSSARSDPEGCPISGAQPWRARSCVAKPNTPTSSVHVLSLLQMSSP